MSERANRFLGDTPARTVVKLVVVSLIVGFVMKFFGIDPMDLFYGIRNFMLELWYRGFDALGQFGDMLIIGATVVIPVFILLRLLNMRK